MADSGLLSLLRKRLFPQKEANGQQQDGAQTVVGSPGFSLGDIILGAASGYAKGSQAGVSEAGLASGLGAGFDTGTALSEQRQRKGALQDLISSDEFKSMSAPEKAFAVRNPDKFLELKFNRDTEFGKTSPAGQGKAFDQEEKLRNNFEQRAKPFVQIRDSFQRILQSTKIPTAAGDLSIIFNYMKMLDPGSTVREGEFATAQNSAGVDERLRAAYNRVVSGERLTPDTRNDFVRTSARLFSGQKSIFDKDVQTFTTLAEAYGLDPSHIATDTFIPDPSAVLSEMDKAALDWANANPKDPRSSEIKRRLSELK